MRRKCLLKEPIDLEEAMLGYKRRKVLLFMLKNSGLKSISPHFQLEIICLSRDASGIE